MNTMRSGLVSITFRKLSPEQICEIAATAGLECIEWGGDIHVPHGDLQAARAVSTLTKQHGLSVSSYGSYYRLGASEGPSKQEVVETAAALNAPLIRVWAGNKGSNDLAVEARRKIVADLKELAEIAKNEEIDIGLEFHGGTLTDTAASTVQLLEETSHSNVKTFWQPPVAMHEDECVAGLKLILPWLANVHAFHWWPDASARRQLSDGAERWKQYLQTIRDAGKSPDVLLEFVAKDDPALLLQETETLHYLLQGDR